MFRCQICNTVSAPSSAAHRVVLKYRPTEYLSRPKAQRQRSGRKSKYSDDPGGAGYEIEKEVLACRSCAEDKAAEQAAADQAELTA